jgi:hypothetical protein
MRASLGSADVLLEADWHGIEEYATVPLASRPLPSTLGNIDFAAHSHPYLEVEATT